MANGSVTGNSDGTAGVWQLATGREVQVLLGHTGPVTGVAVTPDGHWVVTGSWDETRACRSWPRVARCTSCQGAKDISVSP
jgi:WD40 repeat protein